MEEYIGSLWHKLITQRASFDHPSARVELSALNSELAVYFRALGGDAGKTIEVATARQTPVYQRLVDRLAGKLSLTPAWQDERSLRLPASLAIFPEQALNEQAYFWLVALATQLPALRHWSHENQQATLQLLQRRRGLAQQYYRLAEAYCELRQNFFGQRISNTENKLQQALLAPGSVDYLPPDHDQHWPVQLWLYPSPLMQVGVSTDDCLEDGNPSPQTSPQLDIGRKQAQRIDSKKDTDGLLIFRLESLFTWTEQVNVDRPEDEDVDDQAAAAAADLDIITLSRQRRASAGKIRFDMDLPAPANDDLRLGDGIRLPEWDFRKQQLRPAYCLLQPMLADDAPASPLPVELKSEVNRVKRYFAHLNPQTQRKNRQLQGDELDLNAWLQHITQPVKIQDTPACFRALKQQHRDLSCLLLADLSMSTDCGIDTQTRVIDVIRDTLLIFSEALNDTHDQLGIYGFSSVRNKHIRYHVLKNFNEPYSDHVRGRIMSIKPGFYTRLGSAIRQSMAVLGLQKSAQKLLLILSDGKPNDLDQYEGRYGIEDTRQAFLEAKQQGITPFCVTIDADANAYLPYIFGDQGYCIVSNPAQLARVLPKLYLRLTRH